MSTVVGRRGRVGQIFAKSILEALESRQLLSAVPAPLTSVDVGTPTGGSASYDTPSSEFTIVGAGNDIFGAADAFHYVYEPLTGNGSVIVRVDSDSANSAMSLAGLDIRSSLDTTAANMWVATRDTGAVFVDDRTTDGGTGTNVTPGQSPLTFPIFLKLTRNGDSVTAASSADGIAYTTLATDTINLPTTALVGMAVSSQNAPSVLATATFGAFAVSTAPTAALTSATVITPSTTAPYPFTVTYTDPTSVDASTIGNGNILVTGPGGYSQPATLASTGLTNGPSVAATYNLSPLPTVPGTYTITLLPNQVANTSGDQIAGGTVVGTFTVSASNNSASVLGNVIFADGTILAGRTVFLDANANGILDNGELSTTTTNTSAFSFLNVPAGTYTVVQEPAAGQQNLEPLNGSRSVVVTDNQTTSVPTFVDIAANTSGAATNLTLALAGTAPTTGKLGKNIRLSYTVSSSVALPKQKTVKLAILATTDGTIASKVAALAFVKVKLNAKKTSKTFKFNVKLPKTLAAGNYQLVATVDPDGVVAETSKLDNSAVSGVVAIS